MIEPSNLKALPYDRLHGGRIIDSLLDSAIEAALHRHNIDKRLVLARQTMGRSTFHLKRSAFGVRFLSDGGKMRRIRTYAMPDFLTAPLY
jgi:hypothetical protein